MVQVSCCVTTIFTDRPVRCKPSSVRGFFGRANSENTLLHQHLPTGKSAYMYPRVQYRIRNGMAQLIGIEEGVTAVEESTKNLNSIALDHETYRVNFVDYSNQTFELGETTEPIEYRFTSPWLALSQKNYKLYQSSTDYEQKQLLGRILIGNLLSLSKSLDMVVTEHLTCDTFLRHQAVFVKRQQLIGFRGRFRINFRIPEVMGIGHLVSIGFGGVQFNQRILALR